MSKEKPKPIIIKSNEGEDTLPLPITKETKLKNLPVNTGIITPIENEIEIFTKPKKPSYIVFFLLVISPLLFFLIEESINYEYNETYIFTNNPNTIDSASSPNLDWKINNFNVYYHGIVPHPEFYEESHLYEIKIENSEQYLKFLKNIIDPDNREMNLTPKTIDDADRIRIEIGTQFRNQDGNVTNAGGLIVNCGNGLNGDCNEHQTNWIYLYDKPNSQGPSPYGYFCNCGGEQFENSIMLLLSDSFEPTELTIEINYKKDGFFTLFSFLCLPIMGISFYLITKT